MCIRDRQWQVFSVISILISCWSFRAITRTPRASKARRPGLMKSPHRSKFTIPSSVEYSTYNFSATPHPWSKGLLIGASAIYLLSALAFGFHGLIPFDPVDLLGRIVVNLFWIGAMIFAAVKLELPLRLPGWRRLMINQDHFVIQSSTDFTLGLLQPKEIKVPFSMIDEIRVEKCAWNSIRLVVDKTLPPDPLEEVKIAGVQAVSYTHLTLPTIYSV